MNAIYCRCCHVNRAQASHLSVMQLCEACATDLCPGADSERYEQLRAQYAWIGEDPTHSVSRAMAAELLALRSQRSGEFNPALISDALIVKCRKLLAARGVPQGRPMEMVQVKRDWFEIGSVLQDVRHQLFSGSWAS